MNYHFKEIEIQLEKLEIEEKRLELLIRQFYDIFLKMREIGIEEAIKKGLK